MLAKGQLTEIGRCIKELSRYEHRTFGGGSEQAEDRGEVAAVP